MKRFFLALVCIACMVAPAMSSAADITLAWDPNSETDLGGYKIYWGTTPRPPAAKLADHPYPHVADPKNVTQYTVSGLADGTWCFAATAYNTTGAESEFSNEVCTTINSIPPVIPGNLRQTKVTVTSTVSITN